MNKPCKISTYVPSKADGEGYPRVMVDGKRIGQHRVVYCEHNGVTLADIEGQIVRHTCDNTLCIEGEHLILGTQKENIRDAVHRGRFVTRPLDAQKAREIRARKLEDSTVLATEYGVARSTIYRVWRNQIWKEEVISRV